MLSKYSTGTLRIPILLLITTMLPTGAVRVLCHFIDKHREVGLSNDRRNREINRDRIINTSSMALESTLLTTTPCFWTTFVP